MSTDASGGGPKKLTTAEILAAARAKKAAAAAAAEPAAEISVESAAPVADTAAPTPAAPAGDKPKPKSTADILAAARAAKAGAAGAAPAAAESPAPAAPAAASGDKPKPKSTADILAAARAKKAGATAPDAPASEAPKAKPAAAAMAAPGTEGKKLSVQEMLAAVKGGDAAKEGVAAGAAVDKPTLPPAPVRPSLKEKPVAAAKGKDLGRRTFLEVMLTPFVLAWVGFIGATTVGTLGMLRFMLPNVLIEPPSKFKVGTPGDFDLGTVSEKFKAMFGVWIVHSDRYQGRNLIYALSSVCTHLGCTPSWLEAEQKFKCPCHGSGFYISGVNFEGPAPRPLERVGIRIAEDGQLEVDKSVKFQEEMGQWNDAASCVEV